MFVLASSFLVGWGCELQDSTGLCVHPGQRSLLYQGAELLAPSLGFGVVRTLKNAVGTGFGPVVTHIQHTGGGGGWGKGSLPGDVPGFRPW